MYTLPEPALPFHPLRPRVRHSALWEWTLQALPEGRLHNTENTMAAISKLEGGGVLGFSYDSIEDSLSSKTQRRVSSIVCLLLTNG